MRRQRAAVGRGRVGRGCGVRDAADLLRLYALLPVGVAWLLLGVVAGQQHPTGYLMSGVGLLATLAALPPDANDDQPD